MKWLGCILVFASAILRSQEPYSHQGPVRAKIMQWEWTLGSPRGCDSDVEKTLWDELTGGEDEDSVVDRVQEIMEEVEGCD